MRFSMPQVILLNPPQTVKRGFSKAMKGALAKAIKHWHTRFLPRHFRAGAFARYGYKKRHIRRRRFIHRGRKPKYPGEIYGTATPLVDTGLLRDQATRWIYIRGTSKMMTGRMTVPWYTRVKGWRGRGPDKVKELLTTTAEEGAFLRTLIGRHIHRAIGARHHRRVVTL
jgi:hypothetical protein